MGGRRHTARLVTVSFVLEGDAVLLVQHPDDGDRFRGQWNGIGGHVEAGEDILDAARRELREEAGIEPRELSLRGVVHESGLLGHDHVVFVFLGRAGSREVHSPEGLTLRWQPLEQLDALPLVHDAAELLGRSLAEGPPFFATHRYDGSDRPRVATSPAEAARVG